MPDKDGTNDKAGASKGWTDKERLTYLFALIDNSNVKFDYNTTPRPADRTIAACRIMVNRLKATLKNELAALKHGNPNQGASSTKKAAAAASVMTRKRKGKADDGDDDDDGEEKPAKRGRKKKVRVEEEEQEVQPSADEDEDDEIEVKTRGKGEEVGSEDGLFEQLMA